MNFFGESVQVSKKKGFRFKSRVVNFTELSFQKREILDVTQF